MIYKDHDIYARVAGTYSDLFTLTNKGKLEESIDIPIFNDRSIIWYEVAATNAVGETAVFVEIPTIQEAKSIVDRGLRYAARFNG